MIRIFSWLSLLSWIICCEFCFRGIVSFEENYCWLWPGLTIGVGKFETVNDLTYLFSGAPAYKGRPSCPLPVSGTVSFFARCDGVVAYILCCYFVETPAPSGAWPLLPGPP